MSRSLLVSSPFQPAGDQEKVINSISHSINAGHEYQTILGATGTGKTYVMAKVIEKVNRPALIISHNKTLAAQLYKEFREFLPDNSVEYFVSYYDYYQPEAYVAKKDLYIEKDSSINDEIDKLRLRATSALMERRDVVIVSSVSCIYGLGSPEDYRNMNLHIRVGEEVNRDTIIKLLVEMLYQRSDSVFERGSFRVRGDVIDIFPSYFSDTAYRIETFGDEVEGISRLDPLNSKKLESLDSLFVYPAKHFVMQQQKLDKALDGIKLELDKRCKYFEKENKRLERERIYTRTKQDLEMMANTGTVAGIENYSRHLTGRKEGTPPYTLLDYFPKDFICFIDESHVTLPQIRGMYNGDKARKGSLVDYGFRLPSALDNRPLFLEEFFKKTPQKIYISATPGDLELEQSQFTDDLIIRPTGLLDPEIEVLPTEGQIDILLIKIQERIEKKERILITTLTKKMAEDLSDFFKTHRIAVTYLHSDIETIERVEIIKSLRKGDIDVLIGINLLREGLDIPEVSLVAILDADKIGFLRSKRSLIQTVGRAARNSNGHVLMFADKMSEAMQECITETNRRREIQIAHNQKNNITPKTIYKKIDDILERTKEKKIDEEKEMPEIPLEEKIIPEMSFNDDIEKELKYLEKEMKIASDALDFEKAIHLRDKIDKIKKHLS